MMPDDQQQPWKNEPAPPSAEIPPTKLAETTDSMTAHTPGPWHTAPNASNMRSSIVNGEGGYDVAIAYPLNGTITKEETEANARLIAVAPELLKAVQLANEFLDSLPEGWLGKTTGDVGALNDFLYTSRTAVAKVTGQGGQS